MRVNRLTAPLVTALCVGLTACVTVGPDYAPPTPEVPTAWHRLDVNVHPLMHSDANHDLNQWWRRLNDPVLSQLVDEALQASPDLRSAMTRLRESRARRAVAAADRYPDISASGAARRSRSSEETGGGDTRNLFSAGLDAGWELDVFGGVRRSVEAADADLQTAVENLRATQVSLAAEVALNYVDVRNLQTRIAIARDNLASQTETLQLTQWRAQAGLVGSQDVEQARSNREQTRAQIPSLETSLAEAQHRLEILLGHPPGTLQVRLADGAGLPKAPGAIAVGIPADTLHRRPDVRSAERTLAAETARVGVAEAARYPALRLSGSIGVEALEFSALGNRRAATTSLLGSITAPVFNAGRLRQQVEIQDAVRERALVAYETAILGALQEVEDALVGISRSDERTQALTAAAEAANNAAHLARQNYSAGLIDFQAVLDTERNVLSVADNLANTRADNLLALIRLYKALGGGWSPPSEFIEEGKDMP